MATVRAYPKKLFYKINEVSDIVGVEAYVLRYWETKFPTLKPERFGNDERRYRSRDIDLLLRIRTLLYDEKFTIVGAVERIKKDPTGALDAEFREFVAPETDDVAEQSSEAEEAQLSLFKADAAETLRELRAKLKDIRLELSTLCGNT